MLVEKKAFAQLTWATGAGHAAQTTALKDIEGIIVRVDIIISSVTGNPTTTLTLTDENSCLLPITLSSLADGTKHVKNGLSMGGTTDSDFAPVPVNNTTLTLSADPSADAGGSGEILTVDVVLYLRKK